MTNPRFTHTLFFSYGTHLLPSQIESRCTKPEVVARARLPDHEIGFFGYSKVWDGGVISVFAAPESEVWGVVYRLTVGDSNRLDTWQDVRLDGTGSYFHFPAEVFAEDGTSYRVLLYKKNMLGEATLPSLPYLDTIRQGAECRNLPEKYQASLLARAAKTPSYAVPRRGTFDRSLLVDVMCPDCG